MPRVACALESRDEDRALVVVDAEPFGILRRRYPDADVGLLLQPDFDRVVFRRGGEVFAVLLAPSMCRLGPSLAALRPRLERLAETVREACGRDLAPRRLLQALLALEQLAGDLGAGDQARGSEPASPPPPAAGVQHRDHDAEGDRP
jgi:hypothetical protein